MAWSLWSWRECHQDWHMDDLLDELWLLLISEHTWSRVGLAGIPCNGSDRATSV
jgi:hypothetical protein